MEHEINKEEKANALPCVLSQKQIIALIAKVITFKRQELGLKQKELAALAQVSQTTLSQLERGTGYKDIKLFTLIDIAKIIHAEEDILLLLKLFMQEKT